MALEDSDIGSLRTSHFGDVPIEIRVSVGTSRPRVRDLMDINESSVLPLDKSLNDPLELYVGDHLIAYGKLEQMTDENGVHQLGVRVVEVAPEKEI